MATDIILKNSPVEGKVPMAGDLLIGGRQPTLYNNLLIEEMHNG
jgi:hypothetical protein